MKNTTVTCIRLTVLMVCITSAPWLSVNAQPNHHLAIETTQKPTPGYDWKFEFLNMDKYPVDIEIVDALYFDENKPNYQPTLLPKVHILGATNKNGIHFGRLHSTFDIASQPFAHLIVYYNTYRFEYKLPHLTANISVKFIWNGGTLAMEQNNKPIELYPVKVTKESTQQ